MLKRLSNNTDIKYFVDLPIKRKVLLLSILMLTMAYVFLMWTFSSTRPWNYVSMALAVVISLLIVIYVCIFNCFKLDWFVAASLTCVVLSLISFLFNARDSSFPKNVFLIFGFSVVVYQFCSIDKTHQRFLFYCIVVGTLLFSMYYFVYYFKELIDFSSFMRIGDKFDNQNAVARAFVLQAIYFTYIAFVKHKYWAYIAVPFSILLCLSTGSISNTLCCFVVIFLIHFISSSKRGKIITLATTFVLIAIIIAILQFPFASYFKTRIVNIFATFFGTNGKVDESSVGRFDFAVEAFKLFLEKPLFGNGSDTVPLFTYGRGSYSHNNFAEVLSNFGILFFVLYQFLFLYPLSKINFRKNNDCVGYILIYVFIFQLFLVTYYLKIDGLLMPMFASSFTSKLYSLSVSLKNKKICISQHKFEKIIEKKDEYDLIAV